MTSQTLSNKDRDQKILFEQITVILKATYFILITYAITGGAFAYVMRDVVPHTTLIIWGCIFLVVLLIRATIHFFYHHKLKPENARYYSYYIIISLGITGLVWGIGVMLMFPGLELGYQFFIMFIVAGIGGSAFSSNTIFLPGLYAFFPALLLPLAIRMFFMDETLYLAMGSVTLVFMSSLYFFSKNLNRSLIETLRLRFENAELVTQLRIQKNAAEKANNAKSKFLAAASHDLRQPLHALSLFVDALKGSEFDHERASIFPRIDLSLDALRKLFDALLDISRLDAKVVKPEVSCFDLAELLNAMSEEFTPAANEKKLKLKVHSRKLVVRTDRLLLERILRNLISNAIRYTESGGILLSARTRDDKILLQVWDTGVGIPPESKDEVFVEFQQLHNAHRDRIQGLGLGLAIVKRLCLLLEHSLALHSQQGKGSVFNICIPLGDASLMVAIEEDKKKHKWDLSGRCIVVVDDERDILHAMDTLLSRWGCKVVIAESLDDAADSLNKNKLTPDLILSDLRLRNNVTGVEVINSLRKQFGTSIDGILITGETSPEQIKMARESGYEVLQKPVKPIRLRTVINHYLSEADS